MWEELGISGGTAIIILIALYFIVKWAVRNGVREAYEELSHKIQKDISEAGKKEKQKEGSENPYEQP